MDGNRSYVTTHVYWGGEQIEGLSMWYWIGGFSSLFFWRLSGRYYECEHTRWIYKVWGDLFSLGLGPLNLLFVSWRSLYITREIDILLFLRHGVSLMRCFNLDLRVLFWYLCYIDMLRYAEPTPILLPSFFPGGVIFQPSSNSYSLVLPLSL